MLCLTARSYCFMGLGVIVWATSFSQSCLRETDAVESTSKCRQEGYICVSVRQSVRSFKTRVNPNCEMSYCQYCVLKLKKCLIVSI